MNVRGFYSAGYAGKGIPNRQGWYVEAKSGEATVTHVLTSVESALYLDRGKDGFSASAVILIPLEFDRGPRPILTPSQEATMKEFARAWEGALEVDGMVKGYNRGRTLSTKEAIPFLLHPAYHSKNTAARRGAEMRLRKARQAVIESL